jgi:hypothetical protein
MGSVRPAQSKEPAAERAVAEIESERPARLKERAAEEVEAAE